MNVMRKSFQSNYKQIYLKCFANLAQVRQDLQRSLKLGNDEQLEQFIGTAQLLCSQT